MSITKLINLILSFGLIICLGAFIADINSYSLTKMELIDLKAKVELKIKNKEPVYEIVPNNIVYESSFNKENNIVEYSLKKAINLNYQSGKKVVIFGSYYYTAL